MHASIQPYTPTHARVHVCVCLYLCLHVYIYSLYVWFHQESFLAFPEDKHRQPSPHIHSIHSQHAHCIQTSARMNFPRCSRNAPELHIKRGQKQPWSQGPPATIVTSIIVDNAVEVNKLKTLIMNERITCRRSISLYWSNNHLCIFIMISEHEALNKNCVVSHMYIHYLMQRNHYSFFHTRTQKGNTYSGLRAFVSPRARINGKPFGTFWRLVLSAWKRCLKNEYFLTHSFSKQKWGNFLLSFSNYF